MCNELFSSIFTDSIPQWPKNSLSAWLPTFPPHRLGPWGLSTPFALALVALTPKQSDPDSVTPQPCDWASYECEAIPESFPKSLTLADRCGMVVASRAPRGAGLHIVGVGRAMQVQPLCVGCTYMMARRQRLSGDLELVAAH